MPDDSTADGNWLLEPPAPGEVRLSIAIGSDVELSPEARRALDDLMNALGEEEEVTGFMISLGADDLAAVDGRRRCPSRCYVLTKRPPDCPSLVQCRIGIA